MKIHLDRKIADLDKEVAALFDTSAVLPDVDETTDPILSLRAEIQLQFPSFDTLLINDISQAVFLDVGSFDLGGSENPSQFSLEACKQRQREVVAFIKKQRRALGFPPLMFTILEPVAANVDKDRQLHSWKILMRAYGTVSHPYKERLLGQKVG